MGRLQRINTDFSKVSVGDGIGPGGTRLVHREGSLIEQGFEKMDLFGYQMPVRAQQSMRGGLLTIAAGVAMFAVSLVNLQNFYFAFWGENGNISKETSSPTWESEQIPKFGINMRIDGEDKVQEDYEKFFRWTFQQRAVFYGDSSADHPRMKLPIDSVSCVLGNEITYGDSTIGTRVGVCPDPDWSYDHTVDGGEKSFNAPRMNGEYNSEEYLYMDAALVRCDSYGAAAGIACANETEYAQLLGRQIEIGLSWNGILSWEEQDKWRDIVFMNLEPQYWLGIELFFTPVLAEKSDWALKATEKEWAQFSRFYSRRRPIDIKEGEEFFKIYIREEFYSYRESLTFFTLLDLMESSGAFWTFVSITFGYVAYLLNRNKSDTTLENIFMQHGHGTVGQYFDAQYKEKSGFNWKNDRDFVELLMRTRENALKALDAKADKNRALINANAEKIHSGVSSSNGGAILGDEGKKGE